MRRKPLITVVEHDPLLGMLIVEVLAEEQYATTLWTECAGADELIRHTQPDLVILDLWLRRRGDGWKIFDQLQRHPATRHMPVIVCTDDTLLLQPDPDQPSRRPWAVLEKPFDLDVLLHLVADLLTVESQKPEHVGAHAEQPQRARNAVAPLSAR